MTRSRLLRVAVAGCIAVIAAAVFVWWESTRQQTDGVPVADVTLPVTSAPVGGPFELVDHEGRAVTDEAFRGRLMLVFFGFTFCPDVCPTELATIGRTMDALGEDAAAVTPVFITIDPERDNVEAMAGFVGLFHPSLVGLTGTPEQVAEAARAYRVYYARVQDPDASYYLMDHSAFVYLMGPDGENVAVFPPGTPSERMVAEIRRWAEPSPAS